MTLTEDEEDRITRKFADFFEGSPDLQFIVFDLETNGLLGSDVLSISAARCQLGKDRRISLVDQYARYYYPTEEYNWGAIRVNGLDEKTLTRKRGAATYPEHFQDDVLAFKQWCGETKCFAGHNIEGFDCQFFPSGTFPKTLDTAVVTVDIVKMPPTPAMVRAGRTNYKTPKLTEAAQAFGVDTETGILHTSSFDVQVTTKLITVLNRMSFFRPAG